MADNTGLTWDDREEATLVELFSKDISIEKISECLGRSELAIHFRLSKLNLKSLTEETPMNHSGKELDCSDINEDSWLVAGIDGLLTETHVYAKKRDAMDKAEELAGRNVGHRFIVTQLDDTLFAFRSVAWGTL